MLKNKPKKDLGHLNSVVSCLYNHISEITNYTKEIQSLKQAQLKVYQKLENSRNTVLSEDFQETKTYKSIAQETQEDHEMEQENQALLEELSEQNQNLTNTQQAASELNNLLSFFSQKVMEHEEVTQHSKQ